MSDEDGAVEVLARGVCVKQNALLVCHTAGADNTYLPGGHVEFCESAPESLVREMREECGVDSRAGRFLGAIEHTFMQKGRPHAEINLVFALQVPGLEPGVAVQTQEAHLDFRWVPLSQLAEARLEPAALRELIPRWVAGDVTTGWASTY